MKIKEEKLKEREEKMKEVLDICEKYKLSVMYGVTVDFENREIRFKKTNPTSIYHCSFIGLRNALVHYFSKITSRFTRGN